MPATRELLRALTPEVCVAPQLSPAAMADLAALGFKAVINNRPDFEEGPQQPTNAQIEAAARAAGLDYAYLPVQPAFQSPAEIARMGELLAVLPRPLVAFCRSGARSTKLFVAAASAPR